MRRLVRVVAALLLGACASRPAQPPADTVFLGGYVYTADAARGVARAVAVRGERIVAVGDDAALRELVGPHTAVVELGGRMLMPGLEDAHIHTLEIVPTPGCDLDNEPLSLARLSDAVADCARRFPGAGGEVLLVRQWNYAVGNQPDARLPTLRAALDAASPARPVLALGSDGHHGAANSAALALAAAPGGQRVGLSARTLAVEFSAARELVGVDARGEPDGSLNEEARDLVYPGALAATIGAAGPEVLASVARRLAQSGITSIQDPAVTPETLESYRTLFGSGRAGFRMTAAVLLDPDGYRDAVDGRVDVQRMVQELLRLREKYRGVPNMALNAAKIFVDGVLEGDPRADPPTLPNAAVLRPYLQPRFDTDPASGELRVAGYVDTDGPLCREVRAAPEAFAAPEAARAFRVSHGFLPAQCRESSGVLKQPADFVRDYVTALDRSGISAHVHAIGDRAVRVAVDAFAAARAANGPSGLPHVVAHAQLVAPEDVARIGALGLGVVFTFAWAVPGVPYDMTVIPFVDRVASVAALYAPGYYMDNVYPAASIQAAGGLVVAGSDAPVDTRDPRPFANISAAVTRRADSELVYNTAERLDIHAAIAAYTRNAARALQQEAETGSVEVGKKADLIVLDRNIVELAESGHAGQIGRTRVLLTLFGGHEVYRDPAWMPSPLNEYRQIRRPE